MREAPTTETLLQLTLQRAQELRAKRILSVQIALGEMADLTEQTLRLQWTALAKATLASGAELHIRRIAAELQCMTCFEKYHPTKGALFCPKCGGVGAKVIAGEECALEALEVK